MQNRLNVTQKVRHKPLQHKPRVQKQEKKRPTRFKTENSKTSTTLKSNNKRQRDANSAQREIKMTMKRHKNDEEHDKRVQRRKNVT